MKARSGWGSVGEADRFDEVSGRVEVDEDVEDEDALALMSEDEKYDVRWRGADDLGEAREANELVGDEFDDAGEDVVLELKGRLSFSRDDDDDGR